MSNMFHFLPSFAPDYSGFFSALHGLDGLMVLHDPSGCLGNYVSCDEPRWYHDPRPVFTSLLKEMSHSPSGSTVCGSHSSACLRNT